MRRLRPQREASALRPGAHQHQLPPLWAQGTPRNRREALPGAGRGCQAGRSPRGDPRLAPGPTRPEGDEAGPLHTQSPAPWVTQKGQRGCAQAQADQHPCTPRGSGLLGAREGAGRRKSPPWGRSGRRHVSEEPCPHSQVQCIFGGLTALSVPFLSSKLWEAKRLCYTWRRAWHASSPGAM